MADWSPTQPLPAHWSAPTVGFDSSGRVRVAYAQLLSLNPVSTRVAIAERKNGTWVDVFEKKSVPGDIPVDITFGAGADGSAAACFTTVTSTDPATYQWRHYATYAPAATRKWEAPKEIVPASAPSQFVRQRRVKVADNGIAVVIADQFDGQAGSLVITVHPANAGWTTPQKLTPSAGLNGGAVLDVDGLGNPTVAWIHRYQASPQRSSIRVCTASATGTAPPAVALTPENGTDAGGVRLDVNYLGAAVLGVYIGGQAHVTTRDTSSGAWQPFTPLFNSSTAATSSCLDVGITFSGMNYALVRRQGPNTSGNSAVCATRSGYPGVWPSPTPISPLGTESFEGHIAIRKGPAGSEEAVLVYTGAVGFGGGDPGLGLFQASHWPVYSSRPWPAVDLAPQGPAHSIDQVSAAREGTVVVIETIRDELTARSYATAFDAGAPEIIEAAVPGTVTTNQVVQLRSKITDTWSPMAEVAWDFGDGTPVGTGPTVTHGWAAPGPYTVTLTGADRQNNTVTKTFAVTVTAGP
ncbi:PKD domain-containing protein [Mycobacterium sp. E802]|uniref:PKD domain-containing protein n=1 Tax=Mycobacterium sp. E802 TaxID=1834152 RepID=UPI0009ED652D|nr:PKD domain-containing protein [Mycobacterium sp. E802]